MTSRGIKMSQRAVKKTEAMTTSAMKLSNGTVPFKIPARDPIKDKSTSNDTGGTRTDTKKSKAKFGDKFGVNRIYINGEDLTYEVSTNLRTAVVTEKVTCSDIFIDEPTSEDFSKKMNGNETQPHDLLSTVDDGVVEKNEEKNDDDDNNNNNEPANEGTVSFKTRSPKGFPDVKAIIKSFSRAGKSSQSERNYFQFPSLKSPQSKPNKAITTDLNSNEQTEMKFEDTKVANLEKLRNGVTNESSRALRLSKDVPAENPDREISTIQVSSPESGDMVTLGHPISGNQFVSLLCVPINSDDQRRVSKPGMALRKPKSAEANQRRQNVEVFDSHSDESFENLLATSSLMNSVADSREGEDVSATEAKNYEAINSGVPIEDRTSIQAPSRRYSQLVFVSDSSSSSDKSLEWCSNYEVGVKQMTDQGGASTTTRRNSVISTGNSENVVGRSSNGKMTSPSSTELTEIMKKEIKTELDPYLDEIRAKIWLTASSFAGKDSAEEATPIQEALKMMHLDNENPASERSVRRDFTTGIEPTYKAKEIKRDAARIAPVLHLNSAMQSLDDVAFPTSEIEDDSDAESKKSNTKDKGTFPAGNSNSPGSRKSGSIDVYLKPQNGSTNSSPLSYRGINHASINSSPLSPRRINHASTNSFPYDKSSTNSSPFSQIPNIPLPLFLQSGEDENRLVETLHAEYTALLVEHARAKNLIDQLKIGTRVNLTTVEENDAEDSCSVMPDGKKQNERRSDENVFRSYEDHIEDGDVTDEVRKPFATPKDVAVSEWLETLPHPDSSFSKNENLSSQINEVEEKIDTLMILLQTQNVSHEERDKIHAMIRSDLKELSKRFQDSLFNSTLDETNQRTKAELRHRLTRIEAKLEDTYQFVVGQQGPATLNACSKGNETNFDRGNHLNYEFGIESENRIPDPPLNIVKSDSSTPVKCASCHRDQEFFGSYYRTKTSPVVDESLFYAPSPLKNWTPSPRSTNERRGQESPSLRLRERSGLSPKEESEKEKDRDSGFVGSENRFSSQDWTHSLPRRRRYEKSERGKYRRNTIADSVLSVEPRPLLDEDDNALRTSNSKRTKHKIKNDGSDNDSEDSYSSDHNDALAALQKEVRQLKKQLQLQKAAMTPRFTHNLEEAQEQGARNWNAEEIGQESEYNLPFDRHSKTLDRRRGRKWKSSGHLSRSTENVSFAALDFETPETRFGQHINYNQSVTDLHSPHLVASPPPVLSTSTQQRATRPKSLNLHSSHHLAREHRFLSQFQCDTGIEGRHSDIFDSDTDEDVRMNDTRFNEHNHMATFKEGGKHPPQHLANPVYNHSVYNPLFQPSTFSPDVYPNPHYTQERLQFTQKVSWMDPRQLYHSNRTQSSFRSPTSQETTFHQEHGAQLAESKIFNWAPNQRRESKS